MFSINFVKCYWHFGKWRLSLFGAFVFSIKRFCRFQGVQPATDRVRHVPFWGIRVSKINGLPFSGGATDDGSGAACPFLRHSCFQNKWFAVFRGCNRRQWGRGMSQNEQTIYSWNKNVHFRDMQQRISAQNGPNRPKSAELFARMSLFGALSFWE